jgi:hypothetical protein
MSDVQGSGEMRTGFGGKREGKRPLGKPRRGCEQDIKMDLQEVGARTRLIWLRTGTGDGLL